MMHMGNIGTLAHNSVISIFEIMITVFLAGLLFIPSDSSAMDESGKMRWALVYISADSGCSNYQYQMTNAYDEFVTKYFELYTFANSKYKPQCMPDTKYSNYQTPDDLDLLVLVYDKQIGKKEMHTNNVGGLYSHLGDDRTKNHIVVLCDCPTSGFSYPMFALSHEMSHFITYYLGFDLSTQEEIHQISAKFNECNDGYWNNQTCADVVVRVNGDYYFSHATVMAPYAPAIGKKLISTSIDSESAANSILVMNLQKEITKWWLAGKINDTEYASVLEFVRKPSNMSVPYGMPENILLASGRDGQEDKDTYYDLNMDENQKTSILLKRVPFKSINETEISETKIPHWFKSRAYGWSYNQTLSNEEFINLTKSGNDLYFQYSNADSSALNLEKSVQAIRSGISKIEKSVSNIEDF